jgi:hypothetical protein
LLPHFLSNAEVFVNNNNLTLKFFMFVILTHNNTQIPIVEKYHFIILLHEFEIFQRSLIFARPSSLLLFHFT